MRIPLAWLMMVLALPGSVWAYSRTGSELTTDGSWSDVKAACYAATNTGDRVNIPAGNFTWGGDATPLYINTPLTLWGAGTNQTTISISINNTFTFDSGMIRLFTNCVVGNFAANFPTYNNTTLFSVHAAGWHITQLLYDGSNSAGQRFISGLPAGNVGLVDYSAIVANGVGTAELIFLQGPTDAWVTPDTLGSTNAVYVENCKFYSDGYVCDANANARIVVRFCDIYGVMKIDGHGKWSNTPQRSCRSVEAYGNHWYAIGQGGYWDSIELRGGTGMLFNNTVDDGTFVGRGVIDLKEYGTILNGGAWGAVYQTPTYYPVDGQVGVGQDPKVGGSAPVYLWNNTKAGVDQVLNWADIPSAAIQQYTNEVGNTAATFTMRDIIHANKDYFIFNPGFDGTNGMGVGLKSEMLDIVPATTNVGFWVTDEGDWNHAAQPGHSGRLYIWNGSSWVLKYTPLVYPFGSTTNFWVPTPQLPPLAVDDAFSMTAGYPATFNPTRNDLLRTTNGVLAIVEVWPTNGTASFSGNKITFTPDADFTGTAQVLYEITDGILAPNSRALVSISVTNATTPPRGSSGLTAWYKFENDLLDSGTNLNNAAQADGWLEAYSAGTNGQALDLNGTSSSAVVSPYFAGGPNWSIAFWMRPAVTNGVFGLASFVGSYNSYRISCELDLSNGVLTVLSPNQSGNWSDNNLADGWTIFSSSNCLPANIWVHVGLTYNNGFFNLYENGVLVATANSPVPSNWYDWACWCIGGKSYAFGAVNYIGKIDDFKLYQTYTLSQAEVYSAAGLTPPGPVNTLYALTVVNGTGSGSYTNGQVVVIHASTLSGQAFTNWTGFAVADAAASSTTLTMPAANVTVTANFYAVTNAPTPGLTNRYYMFLKP